MKYGDLVSVCRGRSGPPLFGKVVEIDNRKDEVLIKVFKRMFLWVPKNYCRVM